MCRPKAQGLVTFQGEKGFLRLFWTGSPGNLCRLFALASWWLIFHSAGLIWICAAVGEGVDTKLGSLEDNSRMARLPPHRQAGWPGSRLCQEVSLHTANITSQLLLSPVIGLKRLIRYIQAFWRGPPRTAHPSVSEPAAQPLPGEGGSHSPWLTLPTYSFICFLSLRQGWPACFLVGGALGSPGSWWAASFPHQGTGGLPNPISPSP